MKVTLALVSSIDGKTTRWFEPEIYSWTSKEDTDYFFKLVKKSSVVIMGRKTYEAAKSVIELSPKILRIIMTKQPDTYTTEIVPGQLAFSDLAPKRLLKKLKDRGYDSVLLVGGESVTTAFLKAQVITDIYLTIEPKLFGTGNDIVLKEKFAVDLKLRKVKQLNEKGTLLLHYEVLK